MAFTAESPPAHILLDGNIFDNRCLLLASLDGYGFIKCLRYHDERIATRNALMQNKLTRNVKDLGNSHAGANKSQALVAHRHVRKYSLDKGHGIHLGGDQHRDAPGSDGIEHPSAG